MMGWILFHEMKLGTVEGACNLRRIGMHARAACIGSSSLDGCALLKDLYVEIQFRMLQVSVRFSVNDRTGPETLNGMGHVTAI